MVPRLVTLGDLEWPNGHHLALSHKKAGFGAKWVKFAEARPILSATKM